MLSIKELEYSKNDFDDTYLTIDIKNLNYTFVNTLRRILINQIPIYAFDRKKIKIIKNTSVYNNSQLESRLTQLPIYNIDNDFELLDYQSLFQNDNFSEKDKLLNIEYYVKGINNGEDLIKYITTNDVAMYINGKKINIINKNPILIIKLRMGEEIELSLGSSLSIGEFDATYNSSSCYYDEYEDNKFSMTIKSNGQMNEYILLDKSCKIMINKLNNFKITLEKNKEEILNDKMFILNIDNEDYTLLNPINYLLQISDNISFSAITQLEGFLEKKITLKVKTKNNLSPLDEIIKEINNTIKMYEKIHILIKKLKK